MSNILIIFAWYFSCFYSTLVFFLFTFALGNLAGRNLFVLQEVPEHSHDDCCDMWLLCKLLLFRVDSVPVLLSLHLLVLMLTFVDCCSVVASLMFVDWVSASSLSFVNLRRCFNFNAQKWLVRIVDCVDSLSSSLDTSFNATNWFFGAPYFVLFGCEKQYQFLF